VNLETTEKEILNKNQINLEQNLKNKTKEQ